MDSLAIAIAPGLAIILFILYRDKFNREPSTVLVVSFFWGVLSTIPAVIWKKLRAILISMASTALSSLRF
jgi:RsiW-degrading membrane proteinase PrsW (M82 family)